jgi:hypothetical protein
LYQSFTIRIWQASNTTYYKWTIQCWKGPTCFNEIPPSLNSFIMYSATYFKCNCYFPAPGRNYMIHHSVFPIQFKYHFIKTIKSASLYYKMCWKHCPCTTIHCLYHLNKFNLQSSIEFPKFLFVYLPLTLFLYWGSFCRLCP